MKKKIYSIVVISFICAILLFSVVPVAANDNEFIEINAPFTLDPEQPGITLEPGSTIHQLINGETEVYNPDGKLKFKARDSESGIVLRPNGQKAKANHICQIPSGCTIDLKGDTTSIYNNNMKILTLIIDKEKQVNNYPPWGGYIEQANDWGVAAITYFNANWYAPSRPQD